QLGYSRSEIGRMIGGSNFTDELHSALQWVGQAAHPFGTHGQEYVGIYRQSICLGGRDSFRLLGLWPA
ncbi:MAG: hypothetical protein ACK56F_22900, partial [bacterium]